MDEIEVIIILKRYSDKKAQREREREREKKREKERERERERVIKSPAFLLSANLHFSKFTW